MAVQTRNSSKQHANLKFLEWENVKKKKKIKKCHWEDCQPFDDSSKTNITIGFTLWRKTWKPKT